MCGISGAVGLKDISQELFEGIRNLEYRGYDSCGVALMNHKGLVVKKNIGGVEEFYSKEDVLRHKGVSELTSQVEWQDHRLLSFFAGAGFELAPRTVLTRSTAQPLL